MTNRNRQPKQLALTFRTHGGARKGSGRKPGPGRARVSHTKRPVLHASHPVHVTLRMAAGLPSLRAQVTMAAIRKAFFAGKDRLGMRLAHYSVQTNHLHLLVEAEDEQALSRGMKGLNVRIARGLNRVLGRRGRVIADRFHSHPLRSPRETKNALRYVLENVYKHLAQQGMIAPREVDPCSSVGPAAGIRETVAGARTWLLRGAERWLGNLGSFGAIGARC